MSDSFPGVYKEPFTRDCERLHRKISKEACHQLDAKGYVVIDDCFGHGWASALLEEMRWLNDKQHFKPNKTQFALTQSGTDGKPQAYHFVKPHIFEVDLHDASLRTKVPELDALFHSTELLQVLSDHLPQYDLQFSTSDRTLKLQRNAGHGGCFPCHYDNPGAPNKRKVTCLLYRAKVNAPQDSQLRLTQSDLADWFGFLERLRRSPVQRLLSRGVYEEEYYESLMECMQSTSTEGCVELLKSHETHLENVKRNVPLNGFIQRLRDVRAMNNEDPVYVN
jgi:hypothetical protein